jgi:hypothetical protein
MARVGDQLPHESSPAARLAQRQQQQQQRHSRRPSSDGDTKRSSIISTTTATTEKDEDHISHIPATPSSTRSRERNDNEKGKAETDENGDGNGDGGVAKRVRSLASSIRSRHAIPVPTEKRRGLFPWLSLVPEVDRPHDYDNGIKWMLTLFVAVAACAGPMGSAIFYREFQDTFLSFFPRSPRPLLTYPQSPLFDS